MRTGRRIAVLVHGRHVDVDLPRRVDLAGSYRRILAVEDRAVRDRHREFEALALGIAMRAQVGLARVARTHRRIAVAVAARIGKRARAPSPAGGPRARGPRTDDASRAARARPGGSAPRAAGDAAAGSARRPTARAGRPRGPCRGRPCRAARRGARRSCRRSGAAGRPRAAAGPALPPDDVRLRRASTDYDRGRGQAEGSENEASAGES